MPAAKEKAAPLTGQENWGVTVDHRETAMQRQPVEREDEESFEEAPTERISRVLETLGGDARASVRVYKRDPKTRAFAWCRNYTPLEFEEQGDLEGLRQTWGPGDYTIRIHATHPETNKYVVRSAVQLTIAPDPQATAAPVLQQQSEMTAVLQAMQETNRQMFAQIAQALGERPDPMAQLKSTIELVALMNQASGGNGGAKSQLTEIVGAIRELRSVADEINPKPEPADDTGGLLPMAGQLMSMIANAQQAQQQQRQLAPPMPAVVPIAVPPSLRSRRVPARPHQTGGTGADTPSDPEPQPAPEPAATITPELTPEDQEMFAALQALFAETLALATAGKPAEDGADLLYEKLPDPILDIVFSDQWYEALVQVAPQCAQHEAWIREVRAIMLEYDEEDARAEAAEAGSESTAPSPTPITPA